MWHVQDLWNNTFHFHSVFHSYIGHLLARGGGGGGERDFATIWMLMCVLTFSIIPVLFFLQRGQFCVAQPDPAGCHPTSQDWVGHDCSVQVGDRQDLRLRGHSTRNDQGMFTFVPTVIMRDFQGCGGILWVRFSVADPYFLSVLALAVGSSC